MRQTNDTKTLAVDIAAVIQASMRGVDLDHPASADVLAHDVMQALGKAGFAFVRLADIAPHSVTLTPGNTFELPPSTKIQAAAPPAPEPERDDQGLNPRSADDLAERFGCRVMLAGMDDADMPLTDEPDIGEPHFVVVTERATGRLVGLVEAWETEDGDPIVPKTWLEVVLGAWDAARDPQQAA